MFIQSDAANRVRPCAPNKVLLSNVVAVRPAGLYLPTGFQTRTGRELAAAERELNALIPKGIRDKQTFVEIDRGTALHIIAIVEKTLDFSDNEFEWDAMRGLLDYYSDVRDGGDGKVLMLAETGRKLSRDKSGDKSGLSILGGGAIRNLVLDPLRSKPALVLLQQEGTRNLAGRAIDSGGRSWRRREPWNRASLRPRWRRMTKLARQLAKILDSLISGL